MRVVLLLWMIVGGQDVAGPGIDMPDLATWPTTEEAEAATKEQPLVKAWGGFVVDLDNLEVREV